MLLKNFQEKAIEKIVNSTVSSDKAEFILQAPTGSGKTMILLNYMDRLCKEFVEAQDFCFIWLTPGAGELEEQSFEKLNSGDYIVSAKLLSDALNQGFEGNSCYFINYEQVINKKNKSIREGELFNVYDRLKNAHEKGMSFILIVDEEHRNKTKKSQEFINHVQPDFSVRVSATPVSKETENSEYYRINTKEVIESGLLTKHVYINYGVEFEATDYQKSDLEYFLDLAIKKREEIANEYNKINANVNPLVIIQIDNESSLGENENLNDVKQLLEKKSITVEKGNLAIWLDNEKENLENITQNNNEVNFIICKQAIATGWDCPRAKVLVKLRTNTSETFEIQTIGRIRRMPNGRHYGSDLLDNAFIYTYDNNFIIEATNESDAIISVDVKIKSEYKNKKSGLIKEYHVKKNEAYITGSYAICLSRFIKNKLKLTDDTTVNISKLKEEGFEFDDKKTEKLAKVDYIDENNNTLERIHRKGRITMTDDRINYYETISSLGNKLKVNNLEAKKDIIQGVFANKSGVLRLKNQNQLAAFLIKNYDMIKDIFVDFMTQEDASLQVQSNLFTERIEESPYNFPDETEFHYVMKKENEVNEKNNLIENYVYHGVYDNMKLASKCENYFFEHVSNNKDVKWFFKNLDNGKDGFSIIYKPGDGVIENFFPDWILQDKDGNIWIIETKGGSDVDSVSKFKFDALKKYSNKNKVKFAFVRNKGEKLFYSNTVYEHDMNAKDEENKKVWKPLKEIISEK